MNLLAYQDIKYREFQSRLLVTNYEVIGIRMPVLRKIAKEMSEDDINYNFKYYEEVLLCGLLIPKIKDEKRRWQAVNAYLDYLDCWSTCDALCSNLKEVKKDLDKYFPYLLSLESSTKPFHLRFSLVMFLKYYTEEKYLDKILEFISKIPKKDYYVKMAVAWLLCELKIYHSQKIDLYSKTLDLDIQKMYQRKVKDSYRI